LKVLGVVLQGILIFNHHRLSAVINKKTRSLFFCR